MSFALSAMAALALLFGGLPIVTCRLHGPALWVWGAIAVIGPTLLLGIWLEVAGDEDGAGGAILLVAGVVGASVLVNLVTLVARVLSVARRSDRDHSDV